MNDDATIGIRLSAFNWRLRRAREAAGLRQSDLATIAGLSQSFYSEIELLKREPSLEAIEEIAAALDADPAQLFPESVLAVARQKAATAVEFAVSEGDLPKLAAALARNVLPPPVEEAGEIAEMAADVRAALSVLKPHYANALIKRFNLDGDGERTFQEIADEAGTTRGYIQQIEVAAMRRLRHPQRAKRLRSHLSE